MIDKLVLKATEFSKLLLDEYLMLAVRDDKSHDYFILQKSYEFDEQDRKLGMDTYYIEVNGQENSNYGGIRSVEISSNVVSVILTHEVSKLAKIEKVEIFFKENDMSEEYFSEISELIWN